MSCDDATELNQEAARVFAPNNSAAVPQANTGPADDIVLPLTLTPLDFDIARSPPSLPPQGTNGEGDGGERAVLYGVAAIVYWR